MTRKLGQRTDDRPNFSGVWVGNGGDVYTEDGSPFSPFEVRFDLDTLQDPIEGTATLTDFRMPGWENELVLTGTFYNDEYLQMTYRTSDRTMRQLGVAVIRVDASGKEMVVHYAGFSPTRKTFVAGKLNLTRESTTGSLDANVRSSFLSALASSTNLVAIDGSKTPFAFSPANLFDLTFAQLDMDESHMAVLKACLRVLLPTMAEDVDRLPDNPAVDVAKVEQFLVAAASVK